MDYVTLPSIRLLLQFFLSNIDRHVQLIEYHTILRLIA